MKKILICLSLVLIICSTILAGCSEPESTTTSTTSTTTSMTSAATETTTPADSPKYGGILRLKESLPQDAALGDPLNVFGPFTFHASIPLERLFMPTTTPGKLVYVLATGYELAPDKSYYNVFLREGVTFHDGTPFDAEAVKWNLDRVLDAGVSELATVDSISVVDEHTVRLNFSEWNNQIIHDLWHDPCIIVSPTSFKENGAEWAGTHPIGTGPFIFVESESSPTLSVFTRNPNYWQDGLPYLDGVENHMITDSAATEAALLSGEIHGTWSAHKSVQLAM
ncbi:MAG: ABC transporter substrate-binding protein, partial [Dehalococcoidia bacterium]